MLIFDVDDVVVNLSPHYLKDLSEYAGCTIDEIDNSTFNIDIPGMTDRELICRIATESSVKHFDEVRPHEGAIGFLLDYYQYNNSHPLCFLTARKGKEVQEYTYKWFDKYIQHIPYTVYFEENKIDFLRKHNQFTGIVEDRLSTANNAAEVVQTFLVNRLWNNNRTTYQKVVRINKLSDIWNYI